MKRNDYLLALTSGFLSAPEDELNQLYSEFGKYYEFYELGKAGQVSLGGRDSNDQEAGFVQWINSLRKEKIKNVDFVYGTFSSGDLPNHIVSAFAGAQELLLQVTTSKGLKTFTLHTYFSPQSEMKPAQFIELIDAQTQKGKLWDRIIALLQESNEMNNRPAFEEKKIKEYLITREGEYVFDGMASQLMQEVQVECEVMKTPFIIPSALQSLFYKSEFDFGDSDREIVFFYATTELTASEVLLLINAQPFKEEIWEKCAEDLSVYPNPLIPVSTAGELKAFAEKMNVETASNFSHTVCRIICGLCEEHHSKPVVPSSVKDKFGPDEQENARAQARSMLNSKQWFLTANQNPWELYFFELVSAATGEAPREIEEVKKDFRSVLQEIESFAVKIDSPFSEAFGLADYLLSDKVPSGNFDTAHLEAIKKDMLSKRFTDIALENFEARFSYCSEFKKFNWSSSRLFGLIAVSISDVFGGMGSWNDIYVESDPETYERLSAALFKNMKLYFAAMLSV
ncbi:MAG: hypothetical protein K2X86_19075 [Cytophagaceae bacterium]|nr:hypothetical protein [Cytophagaceae bacterium]